MVEKRIRRCNEDGAAFEMSKSMSRFLETYFDRHKKPNHNVETVIDDNDRIITISYREGTNLDFYYINMLI
jgi:hypothetical protein